MTRWLLALLFAFGTVTFLTGCPEEETEVEKAVDEAGEKLDEAGDKIKEGVEGAGDKIEEATEQILLDQKHDLTEPHLLAARLVSINKRKPRPSGRGLFI